MSRVRPMRSSWTASRLRFRAWMLAAACGLGVAYAAPRPEAPESGTASAAAQPHEAFPSGTSSASEPHAAPSGATSYASEPHEAPPSGTSSAASQPLEAPPSGASSASEPHGAPSGGTASASQPHEAPSSGPSPVLGAHAHHRFDDTERYVKMFEDPARAEYQKPAEVVAALQLKPGQNVADLGAGSGYFTFLMARAVGEKGTVYAIDIEPGMIAHLEERAKTEKAPNVRALLAGATDSKLPPASADLVFICDTWHHIDARVDYLKRLRPALKPGARIAVVDYDKRPLPVGPPPDSKLSREDVIREFKTAGFDLAEEHTFLPYQYFLVFSEGKNGT